MYRLPEPAKKWQVGSFFRYTVFPHIVSAETILFWLWPYVVWPLITVHKCAKTIQGRKLFKGGNYMRKYGILCNVKWSSMGKVAQVHSSTETESSPLHQSSPASRLCLIWPIQYSHEEISSSKTFSVYHKKKIKSPGAIWQEEKEWVSEWVFVFKLVVSLAQKVEVKLSFLRSMKKLSQRIWGYFWVLLHFVE